MDKWNIIFRNLTFGCKFDFKRFRDDASKLKLLKQNSENKPLEPPRIQGLEQIGDETNKRKRSDDKSGMAVKRLKTDMDAQISDGEDDESVDTRDESEVQEDNENDMECETSSNDEDDDDADEDDEDDDEDDDDADEDEDDAEKEGMDLEEEEKGDVEIQLFDSKLLNVKKKTKKPKEKLAEKLTQIKQEEVNHFRNERHMHVQGSDVPEPFATFEQLGEECAVNPKILANLKEMNFDKPTDIQSQAIPILLCRRELMACAPTGSGKTLAFVLPILHHLKEPTKQKNSIRALVLAPTIELAKQIHREFNRVGAGLGFRVEFIEKVASEIKKATKKPKKIDILVTTPNRLVFLMKENPSVMSLSSVEWLIVDECDKLFEDGKAGFREQLTAIHAACDSKDVCRGFFSATFSNDLKEWCLCSLENVIQVFVGAKNAATHSIEQELIFTGDETGKLMALREIIRKGFQPPVLIFVQSKERASDLFHELIYDKINVEVIHGDKTQAQRDSIVANFRCGKIWVLICTEVMGRGIDFKGVNLVINYDFPNSAISYIHRIGRTGRASRKGKAITFVATCDLVYLRSIVNVMREAGCIVPDYMLKIKPRSKKLKRKLAKSAIKREPINFQRSKAREIKKKKKADKTEKTPQNDEKTAKSINNGNKTVKLKKKKTGDKTEKPRKPKKKKVPTATLR